MARLFDDASSEYLLATATPPVTATPFTFACWFYPDDLTANHSLISISDNGNSRPYHRLLGVASTDQLYFQVSSSGSSTYNAISTSSYTANTWHHACGVAINTTSIEVYLDGSQDTGTPTSITFSNQDNISIGATLRAAAENYMSGRLAEIAIWDTNLSRAEVSILAACYAPPFVRPQSLVAYWPLIRDEDQDRVGGYDMTPINGPTIAEHPPIIYPTTPYIVVPSVTAPPVGTGMLVHPGMDGGMYG